MSRTIEAPELFNDRSMVPGKPLTVTIPVSPEGIYMGNGEYTNPLDPLFRVTGFKKNSDGSTSWTGIAYIKKAE